MDDYRPSVSGAYGSSLARTPHLDRLASQGIRFDRSYAACPLSTPSRMAFLTGRYPRSVGVTLTPTPLAETEITLGRLLQARGYETVAIGKTHYYCRLKREFNRTIDRREHDLFLASKVRKPLPQGVEILGPWRPGYDPADIWLNAKALPYAFDEEMPDTFLTQRAVEYLSEHHSKPFYLSVGFYVTHSPFRFPIEFQQTFDPKLFRVPEVSPEDAKRIPEIFRNLTSEQKRGIQAAYHTSVAYMDRNLGRILEALDQSGLADNTLVIFNSDHGYLLGEHGRFEKHCCYEEAVRTALVMRYPELIRPGRNTSALVEQIDLVPTILEFCGFENPVNVQGKSFAKLLHETAEAHRPHVISEYSDNAEIMIRTERWKLIYSAGTRRRRDGYYLERFSTGPERWLFDLQNDAAELHNVVDNKENQEIVENFMGILVEHLRNTSHPQSRGLLFESLEQELAYRLEPVEEH